MINIKREVSEDGWMLTEGIGAILFYLIMIGVGAAILYLLFAGSKVAQMQQSLSTMAIQIQGIYSGASSYDGLNNAIVIKAGAAPKKLIKGTALKTPWGGDITVAVGSDVTTFTIQLAGINQEDCSKLAVFQYNMWDSVAVNGSSFTTDASTSSVVNACAASNTIMYTAR